MYRKAEELDVLHRNVPYDFGRLTIPAIDTFPLDRWRRLVAARWRATSSEDLVWFPPAGDLGLRRAISGHVRLTRGIECDASQVIITTGSDSAIDILTRTILEPGDRVGIEDPARLAALHVFKAAEVELIPIPVDQDGVVVECLGDIRGNPPSIVHVTPTHQHPTGATLSLRRRLALLSWAATERVVIIEDDFDSEFGYESVDLDALHALDRSGVVAYVGTFAKVLHPAIEIGYMIVPPALVSAVIARYYTTARQVERVEQAALAIFMRQGEFARHLRRLRRVHRARRDALVNALKQAFGDGVVIGPARSGLTVHVRWPEYPVTTKLLERARSAGVTLASVRPMCIQRPETDPGVVMGFASLSEQHIHDGVETLARVLQQPR